jgi:hypothetical protein
MGEEEVREHRRGSEPLGHRGGVGRKVVDPFAEKTGDDLLGSPPGRRLGGRRRRDVLADRSTASTSSRARGTVIQAILP